MTIDRNQTGIASELLVAGELARRQFNVTITFGATKRIDLLAEKEGKQFKVQVKGMHYLKAKNWRLNKTKLFDDLIIVLVVLHCDNLSTSPEYFLITAKEADILFREYDKGGKTDTYLPYSKKLLEYKDRWQLFNV